MDESVSKSRGGKAGDEATAGERLCRICDKPTGEQSVFAREMMFGSGDEFEYLQCGSCGCLQIAETPEDLSPYYPSDYYSMEFPIAGPLKSFVRGIRARHALGDQSWLGSLLVRRYGEPPFAPWVRQTQVGLDSAILDVGCGEGALLRSMQDAGFSNLTGVDPYVDNDMTIGRGVKILKTTLDRIEPGYDLVMLNHSLEHSPEPIEMLRHVHRILKPNRYALIRVPIADSQAWETYGTDWVQLDAPRHLVILTEPGVAQLCARVGLELREVVHDSDAFQFWGSEQYRRGIPLTDPRSHSVNPGAGLFTSEQIQDFELKAAELNREKRGDQACFYVYKSGP